MPNRLTLERRALALDAAVALAGALLYAPSLRNEFTFDDLRGIVGHPGVTGRLSFDAIVLRRFWGQSFSDPSGPMSWRPLSTLSVWLDWHLGGGRPWLFLLENLLLYGLVIALGGALARRLAPSLSTLARVAMLLVFATLAVHVDVVPSATGRGELLAAALSLGSALAWLAPSPSRGLARPAFATLLALLAALAKESALPAALLGPLLAWRWRDDTRGASLAQCAGGALAGALGTAAQLVFRARYLALAPRGGEHLFDNALLAWTPLRRQWGAAQSLGHALRHAAWPDVLCADYSYGALVPYDTALGSALPGLVCVLALLVVVVRGWRARRPTALAALGFVASYVAVSHVLAPSAQFVADRTFFLSSYWLALTLALGLDASVTRDSLRRAALVLALLFASAQSARAWREAPRWRTNAAWVGYEVRACPLGLRARVNAAGYEARPDESAWHLLVATYVFVRFPAPLSYERSPARWDSSPVELRVARLIAGLGPDRARSLFASAYRLAAAQQLEGARSVLGAWLRRLAPRPVAAPAPAQ